MQIVMHHPGRKNSHLSEDFTVWLFELPTSLWPFTSWFRFEGHIAWIYLSACNFTVHLPLCSFTLISWQLSLKPCHCRESHFLLIFCLAPRSYWKYVSYYVLNGSLTRQQSDWQLTGLPRFDASKGHTLSFVTASREALSKGHYKLTGVWSWTLAQSCAEAENVWIFDPTPSVSLWSWTCPNLRRIVFTAATSKQLNKLWSSWLCSFIQSLVASSILSPNKHSAGYFVPTHIQSLFFS